MRHNDVETNGLWRFSPKTIILTSAGPRDDNFHLLREIISTDWTAQPGEL